MSYFYHILFISTVKTYAVKIILHESFNTICNARPKKLPIPDFRYCNYIIIFIYGIPNTNTY